MVIVTAYLTTDNIKTHGCVSAAKKVVWHTSVLFTGTANSLFLTPHISTTTVPISIKFTYLMFSIYKSLDTKFKRNQPSIAHEIYVLKNCHIFFTFFFFFASFNKSNVEPTKDTLPMYQFLSNLAHL